MPLLEITPNTPSRGDKSRVQKRFVTLFTGRLRRNGAVAQIHWARQDSRQVPHPSDVVLTVPLVVIWLPIVPDEVLVRRAKAHDVLRRRWAAVELLGGDGHKAVLLKERRRKTRWSGPAKEDSGQVRSDQTHLLSRDECWNLGRFHVEERYHNGILITPFLDAQRGHLHRLTDRDPPLQENGSDMLEDTPVSTNCRVVSGSVVSGFGSSPLFSSLSLSPVPSLKFSTDSKVESADLSDRSEP